MDKLRSIDVFVCAVDAGSFSEAARQLDLTSVMVGKHVRLLEAHLGARLLERSTRRQSLTDAGRRFYEEGKKVLEQLHWAEQSVEELRSQPSGLLRISAATTLGECVIATLAARYQLQHPEVRIELDLGNHVVDLIEDGFDLALRIGDLNPGLDLVAQRLGDYHMVICASPDYLHRFGHPQSADELHNHRCLGHLVWNRHSAWRLGADGSIPWPSDNSLLCNAGHALRQAALHGAGLLLQPHILVAQDIADGRLCRVLEAHTPPPRAIHALYRQDRRMLPKTRSFVEWLKLHAPALLTPVPSPQSGVGLA